MNKTIVHMIGQAHLDPVWLWRWTEGRAEALATSQSAVDRLNEYPDFHFVRGEAQIYEWIEREDPALFESIKEFMRQGRWHLVNGIVIQPDMNVPGGESLVRQALIGHSTMHCHPGQRPSTDSLLCLSSDSVEMTAFKRAEDGSGYVARFADRYGQGSGGSFTFDGQVFALAIAPSDVVTRRLVEVDGVWQSSNCDMLERSVS